MAGEPPDPSQPTDANKALPKRNTSSEAGKGLPFLRLGHFRIVALIGSGRTGAVYKGYDESLDRFVAIKVLSPRLLQNADCVRSFRKEATAAARITHPNIVRIHYIGEDAGHHFFATDLVEGESLASGLADRAPLPLDDALAIVEQCLAGLQAAHAQGLVHQNVKPSNVLIESDTGRVILTDFGRIVAPTLYAATGVADTTREAAAYVAPEQARGVPPGPGVDLYALGVILHQMLSGMLPLEADSAERTDRASAPTKPRPLREVAPNVPEQVSAFVARLTDQNPLQRYLDCSAALDELLTIREARAGGPAISVGKRPAVSILAAPDPAAELVHLPDGVDQMAVSSPWQRFRDWAATILRRRAPEFVKQLQSTTQQVDGAVAQYERRLERLTRLETEAESILSEVCHQIRSHRQAAANARAKRLPDGQANGAVTERAPLEKIEEDLAALERHRDEQQRHLGQIQLQLRETQATLERLRNQRDLLKSRLRSAQERLGPEGQERVRRDRRVLALLAATAMVVVFAWLIVPRDGRESPPGPTDDSIGPEGVAAPSVQQREPLAPVQGAVASLLDGVILYLTFEPETFEHVGHEVVVQDLSGHGNHGLVYGPTLAEGGRVGNCVVLDGIGDYIRLPTLLNTEIEENEAFTLSVWIQDTTYKENAFILDGVYPPDKGPRLTRHANGRRFAFVGPLSVTECSAGGFGTQTWHHVAGVWDRSKTLLFINGQLVGEQRGGLSPPGRRNRSPNPCTIIGCQHEQAFETYFAGLLDELLAFNRVLTDAEVQALYRMGLRGARPEPPLGDPPLGDLPTGEVLDRELLAAHQDEMERMRSRVVERTHGIEATAMAVVSDGKRALIACSNGWTFLRDLVNVQELHRERAQPLLTPVHRLILRKDDTCWAACGQSDVIYVVHVKDVHRSAMLRTDMEEVLDIAFSPDGRTLLAGGVTAPSGPHAAPLSVWDPEDRKLLRGYEMPSPQVTAVAYSPDGEGALAACSEDNVVRLIALEDGRETGALVGHSARVNCLAFLPDGRRALTASDDNTVRLWNLETRNQIRQFEGHIKPVRCIDLSCDGRYVLSGGLDGLCCIWEIESGELVWYALPGSSEIASAQFNRDNRFITVVTRHWSLHQWRVPTVIDESAAGEKPVIESRTP